MTHITYHKENNEYLADVGDNLLVGFMANETAPRFVIMESTLEDDAEAVNFDKETALQIIEVLARLIAIADKQDKA